MMDCFKINLEKLADVGTNMLSGSSFQLSSFIKVYISIFLRRF